MKSLQEIRDDIDQIDFSILKLLMQRQKLVVSAAKFKDSPKGETGVIVPSRIDSMMKDRIKKARETGLDEQFVETLFSLIIDHMIGLEMEKWKKYDNTTV